MVSEPTFQEPPVTIIIDENRGGSGNNCSLTINPSFTVASRERVVEFSCHESFVII